MSMAGPFNTIKCCLNTLLLSHIFNINRLFFEEEDGASALGSGDIQHVLGSVKDLKDAIGLEAIATRSATLTCDKTAKQPGEEAVCGSISSCLARWQGGFWPLKRLTSVEQP